jgi:hypothetical protein
MSSLALRLVRRATALLLSASILAACHGGAASPPPFFTGNPPPPFGVASVDNSSPTAFTPLYVKTKGVNPALPVSATFSSSTGFSTTLNAVRIAADGTVVVPVPQPVDVKTGVTGPARLSMVLTQQNQSTAPVSLDVQDIPQLSDYGVSLGVISRTYLNYEAMALGQQLGALRAMQASPINHVDTTQEQANVSKLLQAVIRSRNDVDRVVTNNSLVIPAGTLNGMPLNFDRNSVATMDRVLGMYLISMGPVYQPPGTTTSQRARHAAAAGQRRPSADASQLKTALEWIKHINDVTGPTASAHSALNADNFLDRAVSWAGVAAGAVVVGAGFFAAAGVGGAVAVGAGAAAIGAGIAAFAVGVDVAHIGADIKVVMNAKTQAERDTAYADMKTSAVNGVVDGFGVVLGGIGAGAIFKGITTGAEIALQSSSLVATAYQQYTLKIPEQDRVTSLSAGAQLTNSSLPADQGFAELFGDFLISNGQGPILSGLGGVQIGQPPFAWGITDADGHYALTVPTGSPSIDTGGLHIIGFDPVSGTGLSNVPVDLTGVKPGAVVQVPPMSGTCNDFDANAPDSDDPDCD